MDEWWGNEYGTEVDVPTSMIEDVLGEKENMGE
jgi:hypothetical protein